jgi:ABC-type uncharacterized transport system substrate-binding protein
MVVLNKKCLLSFFEKTNLFLVLQFLIVLSFSTPLMSQEIPVIVSSNSQIYLKVLSGLKYSIKHPIQIYYFNQDFQRISKLLESHASPLPIITIGNQATYYIRKNSSVKNIFTLTNYSREGIQFEKGNSCGFLSEIPIQKIFLSIKDIHPKAKNIVTFYSTPNGNYYTQIANQFDFLYGVHFNSFQISEEEGITKELAKLKNIDAFFLVADPLYSKENFEILTNYSKENHVLLFSTLSSLTDLGLAYSLDMDYFDMGIRTGNLANEQILDSSKCDIGPYALSEKEVLKINQDYLKSSGFSISEDLVLKTEIDELNTVGMDMYFNGKKETALNVFNYILKRSPNHENSNKFSKLILNEKYDDQLKGFMDEGNKLFSSKKYVEARALFEKVLKINPGVTGIKEKIEQCTFQYSEQKRMEGSLLQNTSRQFEAISAYLDSIKIFPQNTASKQALEALRKELGKNIPTMMENGLNLYNLRKYRESIQIFSNILLIEEGNKKSKEYLRLSKEKKEAIERLTNCKNDKENPCAL